MSTFGDTENGFSVEYDHASKTVRITGWGFWNASLVALFDTHALSACIAAGRPFDVVFDAARLKPQGQLAQKSLGAMMAGVHALAPSRFMLVVGSALTRLQLARLARENGVTNWGYSSLGDVDRR